MRCKNCNEEISEFETFCKKCKKNLKKSSSKHNVEELEQLVKEQKKLNELDNTKELVDLNILVKDELKDSKEELNQIKSKEETKDEDKLTKKIKSNKKLIIIVISIVILIIILLLSLLSLDKEEKNNQKEEIKIDYKKVVNEYGESLENIIKNYVLDTGELPTWKDVNELITYKKYDVVCEIHNIYSDGSIYLNSCTVDSKSVEYFYGEKKEEPKEGKKVEVYKTIYEDGFVSYFGSTLNGKILVGEITCKTEDCEFVSGYDKYVLIEEKGMYYLYNYEIDSLEFGPFNKKSDYNYVENILAYRNTLYGLYYEENEKNNVYNVITGKILKNIKGNLIFDVMEFQPSIMYKYNYAVLEDKGKYDFVNLKTGNVSYSINGSVDSFIEDTTNNIVYISSYIDNEKFKLYNSNGKLLFDGKEFDTMNVIDGNLIVADEKGYQIYDPKLKLKLSSKQYNKVLGIYKDFIVVLENNYLKLVDLDDKELALFDFEWDSDKYIFHNLLSGWNTENKKYGIYLVIENKDIPPGKIGSGLKLYFIPETKEIGKIETDGV